MLNKIPTILQKKISSPSRVCANKLPEEIKKFMVDYASFYKWGRDVNLQTIFRLMKMGYSTLPICNLVNCNNQVDIKKKVPFISKGCCVAHALESAMLQDYGVRNTMELKETKEKIKNTMKLHYGVENPTQSKSIMNKIKATNREKYNCD